MKKISIIGFFVVSFMGVLFHFAYQYLPIIIFPKNESIFEHIKLVVIPMSIYLVILLFISDNKIELFNSFITAILVEVLILVGGYYTYSGMIGENIDFVNIALFFIVVLSGFIIIYKKKTLFDLTNSVAVILIIYVLLVVFSLYPLDIPFFISN